VFFWYLLVTVVPFLVVSWRMPNTYPTGGVRRGTVTHIPREPGQPRPVRIQGREYGIRSNEGSCPAYV